jgi:hypothetical protein
MTRAIMPRIPFHALSADSRVWVFPASRPLSPEEEEKMLARVDAFLDGWDAHGTPLTAGREWREGRFLFVAVDEASAPPSGCSIDSLLRVLKDLGETWRMSFLDHSPVWFRSSGGELRSASRIEFRALADAGEVDVDTPVFDNTIIRIDRLRKGEWEKPAGASWHRKAFFSGAPR